MKQEKPELKIEATGIEDAAGMLSRLRAAALAPIEDVPTKVTIRGIGFTVRPIHDASAIRRVLKEAEAQTKNEPGCAAIHGKVISFDEMLNHMALAQVLEYDVPEADPKDRRVSLKEVVELSKVAGADIYKAGRKVLELSGMTPEKLTEDAVDNHPFTVKTPKTGGSGAN